MKPTLHAFAVLLCLAMGPYAGAQEEKDSLPDGLKALKHPDPDVRYRAIDLLLRLGKVSRFAIPNLREALFDDNAFVRIKAAEALWQIERPKAVILLPTLITALKHRTPLVRVRAAAMLGQMKGEAAEAVPWLVRGLRDVELDVKLECISALGEIGPAASDAAGPLLNLTKEDDFFLMEPMVGAALGNLGKDVVPALVKALKETPAKKRVALFALGSIGADARESVPAVAARLKDVDAPIRGQAALALAKMGPAASDATADIEKALDDADPLVKLHAGSALWHVAKDPRGKAVLAKGLAFDKADHRVRACQLLGSMGAGAADFVSPLASQLKEERDANVHVAMLDALAAIGSASSDAASRVRPFLEAKEDEVRLSAAHALYRLTTKPDDTLPVLQRAIANADAGLRRRAYGIAASMGASAKPLVPTLLERLPQEMDAKHALGQALKSIDPEAASKAGIR
jgi:HEAT repeat protein